MENFKKINAHDYYLGLKKSDKGKLLDYIGRRLGVRHATLSRKLRGLSVKGFSELEKDAIASIIKTGEWRGD